MAFFKSFQESLSSVSVSSILDSVSSTVSSTVDGLATAVSDVTYSVSDQLTEQVNTIRNKVQTEEEEPEVSSEQNQSNPVLRSGGTGQTNSKKQAYADEEEERREREKQEQERRNEEEQWEWCHAPAKGWYRKRRDPNQKQTTAQPPNYNSQQTSDSTEQGVSTHREATKHSAPIHSDVSSQESIEKKRDKGQEDTVSKTSTETAYCKDDALEHQISIQKHPSDQILIQDEDQTKNPSAESMISNSGDLQQISSDEGATQGHAKSLKKLNESEVKSLERHSLENNEDQATDEDYETGSRSRCSSEVKDFESDKEASEAHSETAEVSEGKKEAEHAVKDRFRRCTLL